MSNFACPRCGESIEGFESSADAGLSKPSDCKSGTVCVSLAACAAAHHCLASAAPGGDAPEPAAPPVGQSTPSTPTRTAAATDAEEMYVTVWRGGNYLYQSALADFYCRDDPEWICSIPITEDSYARGLREGLEEGANLADSKAKEIDRTGRGYTGSTELRNLAVSLRAKIKTAK